MNFMIQMVSGFKGSVFKRIKNVSYVFAVIRGLFDMTENCMMLNQIYSFPDVNLELIDICNIITRLKFHFMRAWISCFVLMIIVRIVNKKNAAL